MFEHFNLIDHHIYRGGGLPPLTAVAGYQYLVAGNGVFLQAQNRHWQAVIPAAPGTIRGLPALQPQVVSRHGRLPGRLLAAACNHAAEARDAQGRTIEALYYVKWTGGRWQMHRPPQTATGMSVETTQTPGDDVAIELHTHGNHAAYFSDTDNRDEQGLRVYGVLGRVTSDRPQICLRIGVYGCFHPLSLRAVFGTDGLPDLETPPISAVPTTKQSATDFALARSEKQADL